MKIDIPAADWPLLAEKIKAHIAHHYKDVEARRGGYGKGVFHNAMPIIEPLAETSAILQAMAPTVSRRARRRLWPSHAFAWVYSPEARFRPHIDFQEIDYFLSIAVRQDKPWSIAAWEGGEWRVYEHHEGEGVLLRGGADPHTRGPYAGEECIILLLTYCESKAGAARKSRLTGRVDLDPDAEAAALDAVGFDAGALWDRKFPAKARRLEIPLTAEQYAACREDAYRRLYYQQADGAPAVYAGTVSSDLIPFHIEVGQLLEARLGVRPHNGEAWGWAFRDGRTETVRLDDPRWDWRVILPLDDAAAGEWVNIGRPGGRNTCFAIRRGEAILVGGHDWTVRLRGAPADGAIWAVMAFQEREWTALPWPDPDGCPDG